MVDNCKVNIISSKTQTIGLCRHVVNLRKPPKAYISTVFIIYSPSTQYMMSLLFNPQLSSSTLTYYYLRLKIFSLFYIVVFIDVDN